MLHLLSEAPSIGGHIRMALRWCAVDDESIQSFVVTRPNCCSAEFYDAVEEQGGTTTVLEEISLLAHADTSVRWHSRRISWCATATRTT